MIFDMMLQKPSAFKVMIHGTIIFEVEYNTHKYIIAVIWRAFPIVINFPIDVSAHAR